MGLVRTETFSVILKLGIQFLVVYFVDVLLPIALATLQAVLCMVDITQPASWPAQLECVDRKCFKQE
eukprot:7376842-Prymnesium_polylepis.1